MNASRKAENTSGVERATGRLLPMDRRTANDSRVRAREPNGNFAWRQLSLDQGALAPLAAKPTAPFADSEQKKAMTVARFYAECHLNGVDPFSADSAAEEAEKKYDNWWVKTARQKQAQRAHKRQKFAHEHEKLKAPSEGTEGGGSKATSYNETIQHVPLQSISEQSSIRFAKQSAIETLKENGGDTSCNKFLSSLDLLRSEYASRGYDARWSPGDEENILDGTWFTLSKPTFSECLGQKRDSEYLYRLGRLSFDMFRPTSLLCSIQGCFNTIGKLESTGLQDKPLPLRLFALRNKSSVVRRYDISESLTIEAEQTRDGTAQNKAQSGEYVVPRPLKGVIMNEGFCVPDPKVPNRISIWFVGGKLAVEDSEQDLDEWKRIFDQAVAPRRETMELARILAARLLLGAQVPDKLDGDGSMSYQLNRPIGGHGSAYVDVLYCDESLRILRGHQGSIYVSIRSL